ncbi:Hypothetical protein D9617_1g087180 [Elsinoe fawcettii]|nr:Hypothetical protein D9617_1g087180 [Elsinoe fawcettii]
MCQRSTVSALDAEQREGLVSWTDDKASTIHYKTIPQNLESLISHNAPDSIINITPVLSPPLSPPTRPANANMVEIHQYHLPSTKLIPNSPLPLLHYVSFFSPTAMPGIDEIYTLYKRNGWDA